MGYVIIYFLNKKYPTAKMNKKALVAKRKEALEKRLKKEANVRMINIAGKAVFYLAIVPYSQFLTRVFPRSKRVAEYGMSVIRRYRLYPIAEAISRPTHKHGHYLQIIEYLMDEESAWLVLSPRIGVAKARRIIEKRLAKYDLKLANSALYTVEGNRLYVGVNRHIHSNGLRGLSS